MASLYLYYSELCPFCVKVLHFMQEEKITLGMKDVLEDPSHRDELVRKGGKTQVPALEIDGNIMYESDDIIHWLKENYSHDS